MSASIRLEIQNRTPFPMTWAHLARPDDPPGRTPRNLLDQTLPSRRGRVVGDVEPGRVRLVCGFDRSAEGEREREHVESEPHGLGAEGAWSARVEYERERDAFRVQWVDARAVDDDPARPAAGPYRWNGRRGGARTRRSESARRGSR